MSTTGEYVPSYFQLDNESDFNEDLNLPSTPTRHAILSDSVKVNNFFNYTNQLRIFFVILSNVLQDDEEFGLPQVPRASLHS